MIQYTIDCSNRLIRTLIGGETTFTDFGDYVYRIVIDPLFDPHFNSIITVEKGTAEKLVATEVDFKKLMEAYGKYRKGVKWAFVLPDETYLPLMKKSFENVDLHSVQIGFFTDTPSAMLWIDRS